MVNSGPVGPDLTAEQKAELEARVREAFATDPRIRALWPPLLILGDSLSSTPVTWQPADADRAVARVVEAPALVGASSEEVHQALDEMHAWLDAVGQPAAGPDPVPDPYACRWRPYWAPRDAVWLPTLFEHPDGRGDYEWLEREWTDAGGDPASVSSWIEMETVPGGWPGWIPGWEWKLWDNVILFGLILGFWFWLIRVVMGWWS